MEVESELPAIIAITHINARHGWKKARFLLKNLASEEGDEKLFVGLKGFSYPVTSCYIIHRCTGRKLFSQKLEIS